MTTDTRTPKGPGQHDQIDAGIPPCPVNKHGFHGWALCCHDFDNPDHDHAIDHAACASCHFHYADPI